MEWHELNRSVKVTILNLQPGFQLFQKLTPNAYMKFITTAGLVIVKNRKLLLAFSKNKKAWYLPGGKPDDGETTRHALVREIKEELNIDINTDDLI